MKKSLKKIPYELFVHKPHVQCGVALDGDFKIEFLIPMNHIWFEVFGN